MKKLLRLLLCTGLLAGLLTVSAFAADTQLPAKQGDFYVLVNGQYVTFTDAAPQLKDGRSCLPFAAVFEQLGFAQEDMTWDGATGTVTAVKPDVTYNPSNGGEPQQGDLTVQLTIGSKEIKYWYENDLTAAPGGAVTQVTNVLQSEVAPYISNGRTYIPFGLVAQALGYNVGWDSTVGAVIIDDVDAIMAANTETYTLMEKYMAYGTDLSKRNPLVNGSYTMDLTSSSDTAIPGTDLTFNQSNTLKMDGTYSILTQGNSAFQCDMDMNLDFRTWSTDSEILEEEGTPSPFPMTVDFEMRGDMAEGVLYFNSAALAQLMGQPGMENTWYKLDLAGLYGQLGIDYMALIQPGLSMTQGVSFSDFLTDTFKSIPPTSVDATTKDSLAMINALCGDSRFVKSGSSYVNTISGPDGTTGTFTLYTAGNQVNGYALTFSMKDPATGADIRMEAKLQNQKMTLNMTMNQTLYGTQITPDGVTTENVPLADMDMTFTMDGTYRATSSKPQTEPPAQATVVDLMEMFGSVAIPTAA